MEPKQFEAIVAQYGIPNEQGEILTEKEAVQLCGLLCQQKTVPLDDPGYYITSVCIVGNHKQGQVIAVFTFQ